MMYSTIFIIPGLCCPAEERLIKNKLKSVSDIELLEFNFIHQELKVTHNLSDISIISKAINEIGMQAKPKNEFETKKTNTSLTNIKQWIFISIGGVLALGAEICSYISQNEKSVLVVIFAVIAMLLTGKATFKRGWLALKSLTLNINFLMMLAITGAIIIGEWPEAAMVTVLFAMAELIERYSLDKARNAISGLMEMAPEEALVKVDKKWQILPVKDITIDNIVKVKPGDRIPIDGIIISGESRVNQASITGEPIPVAKKVDDTVYAGTINENGTFEFKVTANADSTLLAKIIHAVEEAQSERAPTQKFVDKFATYYTPAMVILAVLVAAIPPLFFNAAFYPWFAKALVLLVIACPCALVISTPVTVVSGLTAAARQGLLIKGGTYLEVGHKLKLIALDKTGTITQGKPTITDIIPFNSIEESRLLQIATSLDTHSEHPVAQAIVNFYQQGQGLLLLNVEQFSAIPGHGVMGLIDNITYYVGNHKLAENNKVCSTNIEAKLERLEKEGKTTVIISTDKEALGIIAVADSVRETSMNALKSLHELGIKTIMLTGDNNLTAETIAKQVGIDEVYANMLPEDKLSIIDKLLAKHQYIGMVGDGINDAPALAKSTIGFAMGSEGTDIALETADVALIENNLDKIPFFIKLSKKTFNTLVQNISFAIVVKVIFFILAIFGKATLWMAVLADMGSSLVVIFNGLKLTRIKPEKKGCCNKC